MSKKSERRKRVREDDGLRARSPKRFKIAEDAQCPVKNSTQNPSKARTFTSPISGVQYEQVQRVKSASPNTPPRKRIDPGFPDYTSQVTRRGLQALQVELETGRMDWTIWTNDYDELTERGSFWSLHTRPEGAVGEIDCNPNAKEERVEKWRRDVKIAVSLARTTIQSDDETETGHKTSIQGETKIL